MRAYKTTDNQIEYIVNGMDRFISFVNNCYNDCFMYYENMEETNEAFKKSPDTFFDDIGIDKKHFFDGLHDYRLLDIAKNVRDDVKNIHNVVIGMFVNPDGSEYPIKIRHWLYDFRMFCYDKNNNLLSLEEQNNRLKNYPHFDASVKRPKSYNTQ